MLCIVKYVAGWTCMLPLLRRDTNRTEFHVVQLQSMYHTLCSVFQGNKTPTDGLPL